MDMSKIYKSNVMGSSNIYNSVYNGDGYDITKIRLNSERIPPIGSMFNFISGNSYNTMDYTVQQNYEQD
jgi:hypothetical protein